jgi:hypothetical protein
MLSCSDSLAVIMSTTDLRADMCSREPLVVWLGRAWSCFSRYWTWLCCRTSTVIASWSSSGSSISGGSAVRCRIAVRMCSSAWTRAFIQRRTDSLPVGFWCGGLARCWLAGRRPRAAISRSGIVSLPSAGTPVAIMYACPAGMPSLRAACS